MRLPDRLLGAVAPKYRAGLFDLDDTLFDHQTHRREALDALGRSIVALSHARLGDLERVHETLLTRTHRALLDGSLSVEEARAERMRGLLAAFGAATDDKLVAACEQTYRQAYDREWRAVPGAIELLASLRHLGVWIGIITNGLHSEQSEKLRRICLEDAIDDLIVSESIGCRKPSREFFAHAVTRSGFRRDQCIVVGDLWEIDIQGALDSELDSIWLNRYDRTHEPNARVTEVASLLPTSAMLGLFLEEKA
jgi:HAD superfamily hydrolase (TIGR01549 family)